MRRIMEAEKDLFENDVMNSMVSASDVMRERAWMGVCDVLAMRERELRELKEKIQGLLK